jgi:hypothetical protein
MLNGVQIKTNHVVLCCVVGVLKFLVILIYEKINIDTFFLKYNIDLKYYNNSFDKFFIGLE